MSVHDATPVFVVSNLDASLRHYKDVLGFSQQAYFGDYAVVRFGEATLHLCEYQPLGKSVGIAYFACDDVDGCYAEMKARGATLVAGPQERYGTREFVAVDPDGNLLTFATG